MDSEESLYEKLSSKFFNLYVTSLSNVDFDRLSALATIELNIRPLKSSNNETNR